MRSPRSPSRRRARCAAPRRGTRGADGAGERGQRPLPGTIVRSSSSSRSVRRGAQEAAALAQLDQIRAGKAVIDARVAELDQQVSAAEATLAPLADLAARIGGRYTEMLQEVDRDPGRSSTPREHEFAVVRGRDVPLGPAWRHLRRRPRRATRDDGAAGQVPRPGLREARRRRRTASQTLRAELETQRRDARGGEGRRPTRRPPTPRRPVTRSPRSGRRSSRRAREAAQQEAAEADRDRVDPVAEGRLRGRARVAPGGVRRHRGAPPRPRLGPRVTRAVRGAAGAGRRS